MDKAGTRLLVRIGASDEGREWAGGMADIKEAWEKCPRADWIIWVLIQIGFDRDNMLGMRNTLLSIRGVGHDPRQADSIRLWVPWDMVKQAVDAWWGAQQAGQARYCTQCGLVHYFTAPECALGRPMFGMIKGAL